MKRKILFAASAILGTVALSQIAMAEPIPIDGDEGYMRLVRWETHLDQRIADGMRDGTIAPDRAWHIQKDLDSVEARALYDHFANQGIDRPTFQNLAQRLGQISARLGEADWHAWDWR